MAPPDTYCPAPSRAEADDYQTIEDRPATRWVDRLIGYCWPAELEAVRTNADPD